MRIRFKMRGAEGKPVHGEGSSSASCPTSPGQEPAPASTRGPYQPRGLAAQVGSSEKPKASGVYSRGTTGRQGYKEGRRTRSICPLSQARKPRGPGSGWQLQVWSLSQGWEDSGSGHGLWLLGELPHRDMRPQVCAAGLCSSGSAGEAGRCLQGFLSGLRRLLHRLHKEVPVWGCPGADQPL